MDNIEYIMRYILCFLAIAVIVNCVWSLVRLHPQKKVYAVLQDMASNKQYPITCYETSVGRSKSCDIVFSNSTVSRSHAVVALRKDGFYVFDTESKAGVYLNGDKISKSAKLSDGDVIAFGTAIMKFFMGNEAQGDISRKGESPAPQPKLINIVDGVEFGLDGDYITIGREAGSNIEISAPYVSRRQAQLTLRRDRWYIEDFGSVTKTTLNGDAVFTPTPLCDGDVIKIGDFAFLYEE